MKICRAIPCIACLVVSLWATIATAQSGGIGAPDTTTDPFLGCYFVDVCERASPEPGKACAADADCVTACNDVDDPVDCCTGSGTGTCVCQSHCVEKVTDVPVAAPEISTLTFDASVQRLFGGTQKLLYRCDLCLDTETGVNPWWYGGSTLQTDGTNGFKVLPEEGCAFGVAARDGVDVSTIRVVGTSGEKLRVECGG